MDNLLSLSNFEDCTWRATFDLQQHRIVDEKRVPGFRDLDGRYVVMNGAIVALFLADTLTLMVGEHLYDDLEHLMPHYWVESGISRLTLSHRGKLVEDLSYTPIDYGIPPELDFTQTDPEDSDYLLWLNNMLSTPERRSGAFRFRRT